MRAELVLGHDLICTLLPKGLQEKTHNLWDYLDFKEDISYSRMEEIHTHTFMVNGF